MNVTRLVVSLLALVTCALAGSARAQSCNPAVVNYIVRDESGEALSAAELRAVYEQLPKSIGAASVSVGEVSFAADGKSYYWPESTNWRQGRKVAALEFANAETCEMRLAEVTLRYNERGMRLIFDLEITRTQPDRRLVIDSLPFQAGTFKLDLSGWRHRRDEMIPAERWTQAGAVFAPILPKLRQKTRAPLRLPTYLASENETEPLYAIIEKATPTYFEIQIAFDSDCTGGASCRYGVITGEAVRRRPKRLKGRAVRLARGMTGYFVESACGANCSDATLSWVQGGYLYTFGIKAAEAATLKKVVNSAIRGGVLNSWASISHSGQIEIFPPA